MAGSGDGQAQQNSYALCSTCFATRSRSASAALVYACLSFVVFFLGPGAGGLTTGTSRRQHRECRLGPSTCRTCFHPLGLACSEQGRPRSRSYKARRMPRS